MLFELNGKNLSTNDSILIRAVPEQSFLSFTFTSQNGNATCTHEVSSEHDWSCVQALPGYCVVIVHPFNPSTTNWAEFGYSGEVGSDGKLIVQMSREQFDSMLVLPPHLIPNYRLPKKEAKTLWDHGYALLNKKAFNVMKSEYWIIPYVNAFLFGTSVIKLQIQTGANHLLKIKVPGVDMPVRFGIDDIIGVEMFAIEGFHVYCIHLKEESLPASLSLVNESVGSLASRMRSLVISMIKPTGVCVFEEIIFALFGKEPRKVPVINDALSKYGFIWRAEKRLLFPLLEVSPQSPNLYRYPVTGNYGDIILLATLGDGSEVRVSKSVIYDGQQTEIINYFESDDQWIVFNYGSFTTKDAEPPILGVVSERIVVKEREDTTRKRTFDNNDVILLESDEEDDSEEKNNQGNESAERQDNTQDTDEIDKKRRRTTDAEEVLNDEDTLERLPSEGDADCFDDELKNRKKTGRFGRIAAAVRHRVTSAKSTVLKAFNPKSSEEKEEEGDESPQTFVRGTTGRNTFGGTAHRVTALKRRSMRVLRNVVGKKPKKDTDTTTKGTVVFEKSDDGEEENQPN